MKTRFKACREACGMTQKEVAISLGVSIQAVSFWETGERIPQPEKLLQIADLYGVPLDALFGRILPSEASQREKMPSETKDRLRSLVERLSDAQCEQFIAIMEQLVKK